MKTAHDLFVSLWSAGVVLRREGDRLAFTATGEPTSPDQLKMMKHAKGELLSLVDGVEPVCALVDGLAVQLNRRDPRKLCYAMAEARGFPAFHAHDVLVGMGDPSWARFAHAGDEPDIFSVLLDLDDVPLVSGKVAA